MRAYTISHLLFRGFTYFRWVGVSMGTKRRAGLAGARKREWSVVDDIDHLPHPLTSCFIGK
jgi:hypothetical protein